MKRINCLTIEQLDKLIQHLGQYTGGGRISYSAVRYYIMTLLMCDAGLRIGEVRQLLYSDLYYYGQPVSTLEVRPEIAKGGRSRSIPVSPRLNTALVLSRAVLRHQENEPNADEVFRSSHLNKTITARAYQIFLANAAMVSIGFHISPHTLRHTFADRLRQVTDIRTVQVLLGHKNLSSTQIYTHPNDKDKSEAIAKLNSQKVTGI